MKYRELWRLRVGKFLYIWLLGAIIYGIVLTIIDDFLVRVMLFFIGFSIATIPIWVAGYVIIKKQINENKKFKHHKIFELFFFLFLFCASFFLTFFVNFMDTEKFISILVTGLGVMFFTINAICAGLFHYSFGFHD